MKPTVRNYSRGYRPRLKSFGVSKIFANYASKRQLENQETSIATPRDNSRNIYKFFFLSVRYVCVCSFSLFDKSLLSNAATMLLMLLFLIFYSPLACYNVYRFVASSLFSCCPIILHIIFVYYSCVDGTEIKDTN